MNDLTESENAQIDDLAKLLDGGLSPFQRRCVLMMAWYGGRASGRARTAEQSDECGHVTTDDHGWRWGCTWRGGHPGEHCKGRRVLEHKSSALPKSDG